MGPDRIDLIDPKWPLLSVYVIVFSLAWEFWIDWGLEISVDIPDFTITSLSDDDSTLGHAINFFDCCLTDRIKRHSDVIKTKIEKIKKPPYDGTYADIIKMSVWLR